MSMFYHPAMFLEEQRYLLSPQPGDRVIDLPSDAKLIIRTTKAWVTFACFVFAFQEGTTIYYDVLFHGEGTADPLKECRHTYVGDNGYVFYMPLDVMAAAIAELQKVFE